ncbi:MAG: hypothetical protein WCA35_18150 [Kovacikia sp.]
MSELYQMIQVQPVFVRMVAAGVAKKTVTTAPWLRLSPLLTQQRKRYSGTSQYIKVYAEGAGDRHGNG